MHCYFFRIGKDFADLLSKFIYSEYVFPEFLFAVHYVFCQRGKPFYELIDIVYRSVYIVGNFGHLFFHVKAYPDGNTSDNIMIAIIDWSVDVLDDNSQNAYHFLTSQGFSLPHCLAHGIVFA